MLIVIAFKISFQTMYHSRIFFNELKISVCHRHPGGYARKCIMVEFWQKKKHQFWPNSAKIQVGIFITQMHFRVS